MEFKKWPRTPRLFNSEVTITEKLDGSNSAIHIERFDTHEDAMKVVESLPSDPTKIVTARGGVALLMAQSRKRLLSADSDNHGFFDWVWKNSETLVSDLGDGTHFGEWYGHKINRGYGLDEKRFALFNVKKWQDKSFLTPQLETVPWLSTEPYFTEELIGRWAVQLKWNGSHANTGYMYPEGLCIYHHAANTVFKYTLDGDGHKSERI